MIADTLVVLIHGSWVGGWCWRPVERLLRNRQIETAAPTLTGLGDRYHLARERTGLNDHTADIAEFLRYVDQENVVLVGHSYGAAVATEVAMSCPAKIRAVIVLDGHLTEAGRSLNETYPELQQILAPFVDPHNPQVVRPVGADMLGLPDTDDTKVLEARLRPLPIRANEDKAQFSGADLACARYYIRFTGFPLFAETAAKAQKKGWQVSGIDTGHMGITTDPERIVEAIARIVDPKR